MKLKYQFEAVDMGDEIILVPVGEGADRVHGILKLNTEGREIVDLLKNETTEASILDALAAKYENDRSVLAGYVESVVAALRGADLLAE